MPASDSPVLPVLTGPTAVGKTGKSLRLAELLGAEVISVDSRQVYREIDIGTAKPSAGELERVPHHFISERSLRNPLSAGEFARLANERIETILGRDRLPLLVGGSGLYLHALQEGLADIPDVPAAIRYRMQRRLDDEGRDALWSELMEVDPEASDRMDPTKTERLLRALEVYHATGKPLSYYYENQPEPPFRYQTVVLKRDRSVLYDRINRRVDRMLDHGLMAEVKTLLSAGFDLSNRTLRTIGYREPIKHFQGAYDYDEMVRLMKRNSRRYAKRQLTWFRRYDDYVWVDADAPVEELLEMFTGVDV